MDENVTFKANGGTCEGYLASPERPGPGVIVIQEWWGLNDQIRGVADMFAREGFNAIAPDFYHGKTAKISEPNEAQKLMLEFFHSNTAAEDARGAAAFLLAHPSTSSRKVGVIGFCMGGGLAILTAAVAPHQVGAVVDCYGVGPTVPQNAAKVKAPVLGIFGGKDESITPDAIDAVAKAVRNAGGTFESHVYPEADHAFLNEKRPGIYRPEDARDAWGRILPFLRTHLA